MKTCNVELICGINDLEIFSCLFAASIHDVDHPGNTNLYEINTNSVIALSYNDKAVLENYHIFKAFHLMQKPGAGILNTFTRQSYSIIRALIIQFVLSTDMAVHFGELANLNNRNKAEDFNPSSTDKDFILSQLIHSSDISNPMKPFEIYSNWVDRLFKEFFAQGDRERNLGMKISFLCDRYTVDTPDSQIGFINGVVMPLFQAMSTALPNMQMVINLIKNNKDEYQKLKDETKKEKEAALI